MDKYLKIVTKAKRIVFKIGSALLVDKQEKVSNQKITRFVNLFARLKQEGKEIILVSSGAMASAKVNFNKPREKYSISEKQALASIGQVNLMEKYKKLFDKKKITVAQILISKFSVNHRTSYLNTQNTIRQLIKMGVLPIINENDPLAIEEIRFGENDILGALTSALVESDLYIILSNVGGLYFYHGQKREQKQYWVEEIQMDHWKAAKKGKTSLGQGGMYSKLEAAKVASSFYIPTLITNGTVKDLYNSIFQKHSGTLFFSKLKKNKNKTANKIKTHKKWLLSNVTPKGEIIIDRGAEKAIIEGKSLLPKGVSGIKGKFIHNDVCNILNQKNEIIARGMSNFSNRDMVKIRGKNLSELESILGHSAEKEIIHCNHLIIL